MNTKNMLIILFISVISIGLFALYRHINLVNERLSKLEYIITHEDFLTNSDKQNICHVNKSDKQNICHVNADQSDDNKHDQHHKDIGLNKEADSNNSIETSDSIKETRNEVNVLSNELNRLDALIDESSNLSNQNAINNNESNRISEILYSENYRNSLLNISNTEPVTSELQELISNVSKNKNKEMAKHVSSEYDDLANVPIENNSELNALIKNKDNIEENTSIDDLESIEKISNKQSYISSNKSDINSNKSDINSNKSDTFTAISEIEVDIFLSRYSARELKEKCKDMGLSQAGTKKHLVERLIKNNPEELLENKSNTINISDN